MTALLRLQVHRLQIGSHLLHFLSKTMPPVITTGPTLSIKTSRIIPARPGTKSWWNSSKQAYRTVMPSAVKSSFFPCISQKDSANKIERSSTANSSICAPFRTGADMISHKYSRFSCSKLMMFNLFAK